MVYIWGKIHRYELIHHLQSCSVASCYTGHLETLEVQVNFIPIF